MKEYKSKYGSFILLLSGGYSLIQNNQTKLITKQNNQTMAGGKYDETQR